ncbi:diacylglycerol kinase family protein [Thermanaerothrix sp. 4228-RoL]|uniref:Diacylglycerol kinase family protein n=1 Tax=Thermanaerothrix solaris TaxID=3058434 RepID=A0ABU3NJR0_9CHLR|nr:diacylglycerol kinase family protein [Thermanaerothrix sp. 4228-RoL]MDT8897090.1 diacylglycerol kinase family protein [Thermanaerothrix sp. 4228-RoL]
MIQFLRSRLPAFRHAFSGLGYVLRTQKNAWIHASATILVIVLGSWLGLDALRWAILIFAIGLVWLSEAFNTAIEAFIDLVNPDTHPLAGIAKDTAAAAVLIAAITAAIIGILILGPPLLQRFFLS